MFAGAKGIYRQLLDGPPRRPFPRPIWTYSQRPVLKTTAVFEMADIIGSILGQCTVMLKARAPWWMYVIACSFFTYFCISAYLGFWGPETLGLVADSVAGHVRTKSVATDSPASRADLQAGDQISAVDGHAILSVWDWFAIPYNSEVGHPISLQIVRYGKPVECIIVPNQRTWLYWRSQAGIYKLTTLFGEFAYLLVAFWIAFSQPYSLHARLGALFLASAASPALYPTEGLGALVRRLPVLLQALLSIEMFLSRLGMGAFFTFFAVFPKILFRARWAWALGWIPILALLPWELQYIFRATYLPNEPTGAPEWITLAIPICWLCYVPLGLLMLFLSYTRLTDITERRRVRVIVAGLAVIVFVSLTGLLAFFPGFFFPGFSRGLFAAFFQSPLVTVVIGISTLALPASFGYAILRHRLFDIRVIVRQGLQYGAARNGLVLMTPALLAVLALDLLLHRDQSLDLIMRERGWIYLSVAILATWLHVRRKQWLLALDRSFFREQYNVQQVLGATVDEVRRARNPEEVAPRLIAQIETAFHPTMVAILLRDSSADHYRAVSFYPANADPIEFSATARFCQLAQVVGKPLQIGDERGSFRDHLPENEIDVIRRAHIDWLIPVSAAAKGCVALLAVGPKRSEQPYSREDLDLLQSVAGSLALLIERPEKILDSEESCLECPGCGTCYDSGFAHCRVDGEALVRATVPRYLQGRLRLERKIGRGGMGIVYEATDTHLDRRVAVKFLGEERLNDASAVARFRREARLLAAFQHTNVVTIFDAGSTMSGRFFLIMELLRGTTLRDELSRRGGLPLGRVTEILRGICAAVDAAHRHSVIHRDLKPENVFLAEQDGGTITKVLDFGLAKLFDSEAATLTLACETREGKIVGTPRYMAPERLLGEPGGEAADIWSIGVVAYEMLTGKYPFVRPPGAPGFAIESYRRFRPLSEEIRDAPADWEDFFVGALAFEPTNRPVSPKLLFAEFQQLLHDKAKEASQR